MARPVHFEIFGADAQKAADFYVAAFGWTVNRWCEEPYWLMSTGEGAGIDGAVAPVQEHAQAVVLTMGVDDLDTAAAVVEKAGGSITSPAMPIPGMGWFRTGLDPNGVVFGIFKDDPSAKA